MISLWYGSNKKKQVKDFMSELTQKHPSLKLDWKFDC